MRPSPRQASPRQGRHDALDDALVVETDKFKLAALTTILLAVAVGALVVLVATHRYDGQPVVRVLGSAAVLIGGGALVTQGIASLASTRPLLVVNRDGVAANLMALGVERFGWEDIRSFDVYKGAGIPGLAIVLDRGAADLLFARLTPFQRLCCRMFQPGLGRMGVLIIPAGYLPMAPGELVESIRERFGSRLGRRGSRSK